MNDLAQLGSWAPVWMFGLLVMAAKTALAVAGVFLLLRLLPKLSAATRYQILFNSIAVALLLPVFGALLPNWYALPSIGGSLSVAPVPALGSSMESEASSVAALVSAASEPQAAANSSSTDDPESAVGTMNGGRLWTLLFGLWFVGVLVLSTRTVMANRVITKLRRQSTSLDDRVWSTLLVEGVQKLRLKTIPRLLVHPESIMPMTLGIADVAILLPAEAKNWPEERRRDVLLHELAHIKRADLLMQAISQLACTLQWFNPWMWWAYQKLIIERERACDDMALRAGADPNRYAKVLLSTAVEYQQAPALGACMARRSELESRLVSILDSSRQRNAVGRARILLVTALALALVVPLSTLAFEQHQSLQSTPLLLAGNTRHSASNSELKQVDELVSGLRSKDAGTFRQIEDLGRNDPILLALAADLFSSTDSDSQLFVDYATFTPRGPDGRVDAGTLIAYLDDDFAVNRAAAAQALGDFKDTASLDALIFALDDENWHVREWTARALGDIADPAAVEALVARLADPQSDVREWTVRALGQIDDEVAVEGLLFGLTDSDSNVREWSARSLGELGSPAAVEGLIGSLNDESENVREWSLRALGQIGDRRALEPISELLDDRSSTIREWSLRALEQIATR